MTSKFTLEWEKGHKLGWLTIETDGGQKIETQVDFKMQTVLDDGAKLEIETGQFRSRSRSRKPLLKESLNNVA